MVALFWSDASGEDRVSFRLDFILLDFCDFMALLSQNVLGVVVFFCFSDILCFAWLSLNCLWFHSRPCGSACLGWCVGQGQNLVLTRLHFALFWWILLLWCCLIVAWFWLCCCCGALMRCLALTFLYFALSCCGGLALISLDCCCLMLPESVDFVQVLLSLSCAS